MTTELILYKRDDCPFCQKVLARARELGSQLDLRDIGEEPGAREALVAVGGKAQVPCLVKGREAMYESMAIISHLESLAARS